MKKQVCNQCSNCAIENTAVLGCVDENCKCHSDRCYCGKIAVKAMVVCEEHLAQHDKVEKMLLKKGLMKKLYA